MTYIIDLDEYESIGTHCITFFVNAENATYFDSFGVEHILKKIRKFIGKKSVIRNIYRVQGYDLIMCRHFCTGFINSMLKDKSLLEYTCLFLPKEYKRNENIILKYFQ